MALERRNPLPSGLYWLDVFGDNRAKFEAWRKLNASLVRVVASESFDSEPPRDWVKLEVLSPAPWDAKTFGFPTIIKPGEPVNSSGDTVQRPPPEKDPLDSLGDALSGESFSKLAGFVIAGVALVFAVNAVVSGPRRARGW